MAKLTRRASSLVAILDNADSLRSTLASDLLWWRGQADATWALQPGVFRDDATKEYEWEIASRFLIGASTRYAKLPAPDDHVAWLTLMQHYRLPTRLLDWTESLLVALYFAVSELPDRDGTVWALNPYAINKSVFGKLAIALAATPTVRELVEPVFTKTAKDSARVVAFVPHESDARMLLQQSMYTVHGRGKVMRKSWKNSGALARINIEAKDKRRLREALERVGIRRSTLFADLDNLAIDIRYRYFAQRQQLVDSGKRREAELKRLQEFEAREKMRLQGEGAT